MATVVVTAPSAVGTMTSRPQVGIDRLPTQRPSSDEKEVMNCKSCRKRKIKCNRLKPSCEACQVFNCACIYDAMPKKRGPKSEALEALIKRVNGLEKRLKDDGSEPTEAEHTPTGPYVEISTNQHRDSVSSLPQVGSPDQPADFQRRESHHRLPKPTSQALAAPPLPERNQLPVTDLVLDAYFLRLHEKPYYVLDETATRQRLRDGMLPRFLLNALYAVGLRFVSQLRASHTEAVRSSLNYIKLSRSEIDVDEPTIEHLQALLLLTMASFQCGIGKKSYMLLHHATTMATALNLHRELPTYLKVAYSEREGRRKLFWTCYVMDRCHSCGSKRPAFFSDDSIQLRLPAWQAAGTTTWLDGNYFPNGSSLQYSSGISNAGQGSCAMLVEIIRILGSANSYLASGGVKGDSHFPWHAQSTLSKIRGDLDYWAAETSEIFNTFHSVLSRADHTILILSKLTYHLIHCLIYRPFLPVHLAEISGAGQNQSWQAEATNWCFMHANAIAELVETGRQALIADWPAFTGYCIATAGTIHIHGMHYMSLRQLDAFANSATLLSRELTYLSELRYSWACLQHQSETVQKVLELHHQLFNSFSNSAVRFSPVFQMEDFFERYAGVDIDGAYVPFTDCTPDTWSENRAELETSAAHVSAWMQPSFDALQSANAKMPNGYQENEAERSVASQKKRKLTNEPATAAFNAIDFSSVNFSEDSARKGAPSEPRRPSMNSSSLTKSSAQGLAPQQQPNPHDEPSAQYYLMTPKLPQNALSPLVGFSPLPSGIAQLPDHMTPGAGSMSAESTLADAEKDPFLSFLEELAKNDSSIAEGSADFDFFMSGMDQVEETGL